MRGNSLVEQQLVQLDQPWGVSPRVSLKKGDQGHARCPGGWLQMGWARWLRPQDYSRGAITRLTIAITLMRMFMEGPEVSLKGSPTVSPTTAAA